MIHLVLSWYLYVCHSCPHEITYFIVDRDHDTSGIIIVLLLFHAEHGPIGVPDFIVLLVWVVLVWTKPPLHFSGNVTQNPPVIAPWSTPHVQIQPWSPFEFDLKSILEVMRGSPVPNGLFGWLVGWLVGLSISPRFSWSIPPINSSLTFQCKMSLWGLFRHSEAGLKIL